MKFMSTVMTAYTEISGSDASMFFIKNTGDYLEWTEQIITERREN